MIDRYLCNIMDVPGAEGLCLLNRDGKLVVSRMPEYVIPEVYEDLTRRIIALYEAIDEHFIPCDDYLLKYPQKWLFLRRTENAILVVMSDIKINVMSLRMVTNMALKSISAQAIASLPPAAPPVAKAPAPAAAKASSPVPIATPASAKAPEVKPAPPAPVEEDSQSFEVRPRNRVPPVERPAGSAPRTYRGQSY